MPLRLISIEPLAAEKGTINFPELPVINFNTFHQGIKRSVLDAYLELRPQWVLRPTMHYTDVLRAYTEFFVKTCDTSLITVTQKKKRNPKWPKSKREMIDEKQKREQMALF